MTSKVFDSIMKRHNVIQFDPLGEKFDPNIHEAMFQVTLEDKSHHEIIDVQQSGWKIGERVLRAAKVGINNKK